MATLNGSQAAASDSRRCVLRVWVILFVAALFVASAFVVGPPLAHALAAFIPVVALMFAVELTADTRKKLSNREYWRIGRAPVVEVSLSRRIWCALLNVVIASSALLVLLQTRQPSSNEMSLLRLAAGVALLYAAAALIFEVCDVCFLMAGYSLPLMHRAPIAARSVGEFWGDRWNRIVSAWLRAHVFWPLARRRFAGPGVLCCFLVSGFFHAWPMWTSLGASAGLSTFTFFFIQGVVVLIENRLKIRIWPVAIARAWTLVILLGSSPLFIDPGLRLFGL